MIKSLFHIIVLTVVGVLVLWLVLARPLIAEGDAPTVRSAVDAQPRLLSTAVERDGQGGWTPLHLAVAAGAGGEHGGALKVRVAAPPVEI